MRIVSRFHFNSGRDYWTVVKNILKYYNLKEEDIDVVGATFSEKDKMISEMQVQEEVAKHKYVLSFFTMPIAWYRRRLFYSAWQGSLLLMGEPEVNAFPECYKLDASIFKKSTEEQLAVVKQQADFVASIERTYDQNLREFMKMMNFMKK